MISSEGSWKSSRSDCREPKGKPAARQTHRGDRHQHRPHRPRGAAALQPPESDNPRRVETIDISETKAHLLYPRRWEGKEDSHISSGAHRA